MMRRIFLVHISLSFWTLFPFLSYSLHEALRAKASNTYVKYFIHSGEDVNAPNHKVPFNGDRPLHVAARAQEPRLVKLLLQRGANITALNGDNHSSNRNTPLGIALMYLNNVAVVKLLIAALQKKGIPTQEWGSAGNPCLFIAVRKNNPECLQLLLAAGCSPDQKDYVNFFFLHHFLKR
jgi:ankyrin repeat protein